MDDAAVHSWIHEHLEYILGVNRIFVEIPSENRYPLGDELNVQLQANRFLQQLGFTTDVFLPTDVQGLLEHEAFLRDGRDYSLRPNVVGLKKGRGGGRSLIFSGHMDTVPLQSHWSKNPFGGDVVNGKQYGIGIFDMKAGMVAAMMASQCLDELGYELLGDLMIECVVDEEFGGANGTLACRLKGYNADAAIIPEPTNMHICPVNQGGAYFRITFKGNSGRSYSGEALINPVFAAGRFLGIIEKYHEWRNATRQSHPLFDDSVSFPTVVQRLNAGNALSDLGDRVPDECTIDLWIQCNPGVTEEQIRREFIGFCSPLIEYDEIITKCRPEIEKKMRFLPGTEIDSNHGIVQTLQSASQGLPIAGAPFACDSFMFNLHSLTPAVIFGPRGGNAHAADEFIDVTDFLDLIEVYAHTIILWCGYVQ